MTENYSLKDLVNKSSAMNQMRNVVYHMVRFMQEKDISDEDIELRLKRMGKNIATSNAHLFDFNLKDPEIVIKKIYKVMFGSKVTINFERGVYKVEDKNCPLCKYKREDIRISPGTIVPSLIAEILTINGFKVNEAKVLCSKSLGDVSCTHMYELMGGKY